MTLKMIVVKKDGAIQMTYEDASTRVLTDVSMADAILSSAEVLDRPLPAAVMSSCKDCTETSQVCKTCQGKLEFGWMCPTCKTLRKQ